jgi:tellurite methyltransferase
MPDSPGTPLIDCRQWNDYCAGHIQGATSLPAEQLFQRMHELPQRRIPLSLCGDDHSLSVARDFLSDREFTIHREIVWSAELAAALAQQQKLESGETSHRLWQPAPLITDFINNILPDLSGTPKNGLDIACGAGRDMVYLAMHGWQMLGLDNSAEALQRTQQLASFNRVSVQTQLIDLEKAENPFADIPALHDNSLDLVCGFRYLHRPLFPHLQRLLKPGGFMVYQTFMAGCEKISSPRNPRFLLQPDELATTFASFDILENDVIRLDDGRPMSAFIARKKL